MGALTLRENSEIYTTWHSRFAEPYTVAVLEIIAIGDREIPDVYKSSLTEPRIEKLLISCRHLVFYTIPVFCKAIQQVPLGTKNIDAHVIIQFLICIRAEAYVLLVWDPPF